MNKEHRIFVWQVLISFLALMVLVSIVESFFKRDNSSIEYIAESNKLNSLRTSSSIILENMIANNSVTYDPTNGIKIKQVIENLKQTNKSKILILGSSQYVTLNDDWSDDKYLRRVDKLLQDKFKGKVIVHNLSLGGMTISEKKIVLDKVLKLYEYDVIITSIGPYDSVKDDIRKTIKDIEAIEIRANEYRQLNENLDKESNSFSISKINKEIEKKMKNHVNDKVFFFKNKYAIKLWLEDKLKKSTKQSKPKEPLGWETTNQNLNNQTGWVNDFYNSKSRALKIEKTSFDTNAKWTGYKVNLDKPSKEIHLSSWYKTQGVKSTKLFCLDFKLDFIDGTYKWYYKDLLYNEGTNEWNFIESTFKSKKDIIAITPNVLFYEGTGTLWVDDIEAKAVYDDKTKSKNLVINSNIEEYQDIKEVYSIDFTDEQWKNIYKNAKELLTHLHEIVPKKTKSYLLIPPAYNSKYKNTYSQDYELNVFYSNLKSQSQNYKINYLDASKILDESHFIEYKTGKKKGYIEPLHFDSRGHEILANYLKNNISL